MSFLVRLFQQALVFISVYMTLYFWGESTYLKINNVLFFLSITTCIAQPFLNCLWNGEIALFESMLFSTLLTCIIILLSIVCRDNSIFFIVIYVYLRTIERFIYITCCQQESVYKAQLNTLKLYIVDAVMIVVFYIAFNDSDVDWVYSRLTPSIIAFSLLFVFFRSQLIQEYRALSDFKVNISTLLHIINGYIKSFYYLLYFLLNTLTLNVDRYILNNTTSFSLKFSASYLFYLSVFLALFGLVTYSFDHLRKNIIEGKGTEVNKMIFQSFMIFLLVEIVVLIVNCYLPWVLAIFKVPKLAPEYTITLSFLVYSVYCLMLASTYLIQVGKWRFALVGSFLVLFVKLFSCWYLDIYLSNICTGLVSFSFFYIMMKCDFKKNGLTV